MSEIDTEAVRLQRTLRVLVEHMREAAHAGRWSSDDKCDTSTVLFWVGECITAATGAKGDSCTNVFAHLVRFLGR